MIDGFNNIGLDFAAVKNLKIEVKNLSHKSEVKDYSEGANAKLKFEELKNIAIKPTEKGGGITSQVNFATSAKTFDDFQKINQEKPLDSEKEKPGFNPQAIIATLEGEIKKMIIATGIKLSPNLKIFTNQLARTFSGQFAVPAINAVKEIQGKIFKDEYEDDRDKKKKNTKKNNKEEGINNKKNKNQLAILMFSAYLSSAVKDVHGAWIKDSLMNIGLGILTDSEWEDVKAKLVNGKLKEDIKKLTLPEFTNINGFEGNLDEGNKLIEEHLTFAKNQNVNRIRFDGTSN